LHVEAHLFGILGIFDDCTPECLASVADISQFGRNVARELDQLITVRGKPKVIVGGNGTALTSNAIVARAAEVVGGLAL
jgi:putative transposase